MRCLLASRTDAAKLFCKCDDGTPGWEALEEIVGGLEGGRSVSFASGMAGLASIFDQLPTGSVVALPDDCTRVSRDSPKLARAAAGGRCIASPSPTIETNRYAGVTSASDA
jgi:cystathionine beta-lyase/cystathionine gamma-synthase